MTQDKVTGERIAKVMARAGVASRRDAERLIVEGRVAVNGKVITSPALDVLTSDRVTLDGKPIDAPQPARLWLYYKPLGLITSEKDEKGRQTVFDTLPEGMPRVMSIGRLDLNSEGLLLLTNDGELKRRLELPSTGWLRKYRVRVNGRPNEATFDPLRRGITLDGEDLLPMEISLDKQQGANAWLTVGLREGKNREIRRTMTEVGLIVNRLIRVSYGPFRLNTMKPGDVVEVKQRVLREQLGESGGTDDEGPQREGAAPRARADFKPRPLRDEGGDGPRKPRPARSFEGGADKRSDFKPRAPREDGGDPARKPRPARSFEGGADKRSDFKPRPARSFDGDGPGKRIDFKPRAPREDGGDPARKPRPARSFEGGADKRTDFKPRAPREDGGDPARKSRPARSFEGGADKRSDFKPRPARSFDGDGPGKRTDFKPRAPREDGGDPARKPRFEGAGGRKPSAAGGKSGYAKPAPGGFAKPAGAGGPRKGPGGGKGPDGKGPGGKGPGGKAAGGKGFGPRRKD